MSEFQYLPGTALPYSVNPSTGPVVSYSPQRYGTGLFNAPPAVSPPRYLPQTTNVVPSVQQVPYSFSPQALQQPVVQQTPIQQAVVQQVPPQQPVVTSVTQQAPIKGESRFEYIPYEKSYIEYEEVRQIIQVPVERFVTDYYAVEYQTEYIPQVFQEKYTEYVPVDRYQERVEYVAYERQIVHQPQQNAPVQPLPVQPTQTVQTVVPQPPVKTIVPQVPVQNVLPQAPIPVQTIVPPVLQNVFPQAPVQTIVPQPQNLSYSPVRPVQSLPVQPVQSLPVGQVPRYVPPPLNKPPSQNTNTSPSKKGQAPAKSFLDRLFE